jgi:hypothetical protein
MTGQQFKKVKVQQENIIEDNKLEESKTSIIEKSFTTIMLVIYDG